MTIFWISYGIVVLLLIIAHWRIFEKAGQPGWASIIPIYNTLVTLRIVGKPWWWLLLMLIPILNIVYAIWMLNLLCKSFGKDAGFTLGMIFLPMVFYPLLGFGSAQYIGAQSKEAIRERQGQSF